MLEGRGDLWDYWAAGMWIGCPVNGDRDTRGSLVMGRGVALQVRQRFPDAARTIGMAVEKFGNIVLAFPAWRLVTVPTKASWRDPADIGLMVRSARQLNDVAARDDLTILVPRLGCGAGGLDWGDVRPYLEAVLSDRIIVLEYAWDGASHAV